MREVVLKFTFSGLYLYLLLSLKFSNPCFPFSHRPCDGSRWCVQERSSRPAPNRRNPSAVPLVSWAVRWCMHGGIIPSVSAVRGWRPGRHHRDDDVLQLVDADAAASLCLLEPAVHLRPERGRPASSIPNDSAVRSPGFISCMEVITRRSCCWRPAARRVHSQDFPAPQERASQPPRRTGCRAWRWLEMSRL